MLAEERRLRIRELLASQRTVTASELNNMLGVTAATVRRDLAVLEREGFLVRSHGGAVSRTTSTAFQASYDTLLRVNRSEKQIIAREAEKHILDGETVFLEGSTTVYELARRLARRTRLAVITNSPEILCQLHSSPGLSIIAIGGQLQKENLYISGSWAERALDEIRVDKAILGVTAVDASYGMSTANHSEAEIKKRIIKAARVRIALADHSKVGKQSFAFVGPVTDIDLLITDSAVDCRQVEEMRKAGVEVVVAGGELKGESESKNINQNS